MLEERPSDPVNRDPRIRERDVARLHPAIDRTARLDALRDLKARGVLSGAEYEKQRAEIADEL